MCRVRFRERPSAWTRPRGSAGPGPKPSARRWGRGGCPTSSWPSGTPCAGSCVNGSVRSRRNFLTPPASTRLTSWRSRRRHTHWDSARSDTARARRCRPGRPRPGRGGGGSGQVSPRRTVPRRRHVRCQAPERDVRREPDLFDRYARPLIDGDPARPFTAMSESAGGSDPHGQSRAAPSVTAITTSSTAKDVGNPRRHRTARRRVRADRSAKGPAGHHLPRRRE